MLFEAKYDWITPEVLIQLQKTLYSDVRIASVCGCSVSTILQLRKRYGIPSSGCGGRPATHEILWHPQIMDALLARYGSPREVARALGVNYAVVKTAIVRGRSGQAPIAPKIEIDT